MVSFLVLYVIKRSLAKKNVSLSYYFLVIGVSSKLIVKCLSKQVTVDDDP